MQNKDSEDGPILDPNSEKKVFTFPKSTSKTDSSRQIICQPLKILNENQNFRLVCVYEDLEFDAENYQMFRNYDYGVVINNDFNGFDIGMNTIRIYRNNVTGGIGFYKLNETHAIFVMRRLFFDINIKKEGEQIKLEYKKTTPSSINFYTEMDLFDYKYDFFFTAEKVNFKNYNNIYSLAVYKLSYNNHFKFYDHLENYIKRIFCFYDQSTSIIYILYQTIDKIKYISLNYIENIFKIGSYSHTIEIKTNEEINYNINSLNDFSSLGDLNVDAITRTISDSISTEKFGFDFSELFMDNNILIPEKSFKTWYKYNLSFIEHIENDYTRIYYLYDVNIIVKTCYSQDCISCWDNYNQCDDCINGNYALLIDNENKCYPNDKLLKGYIYNEGTHKFNKCYHSCDFCSDSSEDNTNHKCIYCADGYLLSYAHPGNCYKLNDLQIGEEKIVNDNENFISSSCSGNKIMSTGECIEECPISTPFKSFEYDSNLKQYIQKNDLIPPKYLFNKKCYESCPSNSIENDEYNKCECNFAFHIENEEAVCYSDSNCISDYPYKNIDTNQCFSSLEKCDFFFQ